MRKRYPSKRVTIGQGKQRRRISRRRFLAETTLAGAALTLPAWLTGCGDERVEAPAPPVPTASPTPGPQARERRTLHFDFSFGNLRDLTLTAANSQSNGAAILQHTQESRARHRQNSPALAAVPDEQLTHYIEDVDLPADALQMLMATGVDAGTGEAALAALYIHVPTASVAGTVSGSPTTIEDLVINVKGFITPWDTAIALVFHSPEVMNLNVDQGGAILGMINSLPCTPGDTTCTQVPFLATLASAIANKWPATTSGGWATLLPVRDANGTLVVDGSGNPVYTYDLDAGVAQSVTSVAAQIKPYIFNDARFKGTNWHPTEGITVSQPAATATAAAASFAVTAAHPRETHVHGVKFEAVEVLDAVNRTVQLQFRNDYIRFMSAFVQFANAAGDLPVQNSDPQDTSRSQFLSLINSNYTILGIPLFGNDVPLQGVQFNVPADASIAKVYFGSLGTGGQAFCPEAVPGSVLTLIFNIGIPTILLVAGTAITPGVFKKLGQVAGDVFSSIAGKLPFIIGLAAPGIVNGIFGATDSKSAVGILTSLANALLSAFFATADGIGFLLGLLKVEVEQNVTDSALGPIGIALRLAAIAADVATIGQTVGEVLANPALFINQLTLSQTTTVTVHHDANDFQFPATARNYEVTLTYDAVSKVAHKQSGTIAPGRADPIVVAFDNVPAGGMVTVDIYLTTDTGYIVGRSTDGNGNVGPYGPVSGTETAIDVTIKELLIPLTATTQYVHDVKLEYQGGQHVWVQTAAPTATIASLMQGNDNALNDLTGITISQRTGMAGYSFLAGGQGVPFCGTGNSGIMHMLQNVFLGQNPDKGLKQLPCGFQQTPGIAYEKLGAPTSGRNFFLQPSPSGFLLQSVPLDQAPFDIANPLTWGIFSEALDSLVVVPSGYVLGVDRQNHKMQILELPAAPSNPSTAPQAVPFSFSKMGRGTRVGLLLAPVAVTVFQSTVLILEDGNQRIQAVDVSGNPVLRFQNGASNTVELEKGSGITYLDLGVEGLGYLYVLSYVNDGRTAADYRLDIYDPQGNHLTRTTGVAAARMAVDTFRNVYTLNYETIANAPRVEPSLSQWNPCPPTGCPAPPAA
jgi:hypothetical protein